MRRFLVGILYLLFAMTSFATDWYVNSAASGSASGTLANPFTALPTQAQQGNFTPGDTIHIAPGTGATYGTLTVYAAGTAAGGQITYCGWFTSGATAITPVASNGPLLTNVANGATYGYITLRNLNITEVGTSTTSNGIDLPGVTGWVIDGCWVHGLASGATGIGHNTTTLNQNCVITCSTIQDCGTQAVFPSSTILGDQIEAMALSCLIEYNNLGRGNDDIDLYGQFNIYRNNAKSAMLVSDLGNTSGVQSVTTVNVTASGTSGGTGYSNNDVLTLLSPAANDYPAGSGATATVTNEVGGVIQAGGISLTTGGTNYYMPLNPVGVLAVSEGTGTGARIFALSAIQDPHIDAMQSDFIVGATYQFGHNLMEANFSNENDTVNAHGIIIRDAGGMGVPNNQINLNHFIRRLNVLAFNGSIDGLYQGMNSIRSYNNTTSYAQNAVTYEGTPDADYYVEEVNESQQSTSGHNLAWNAVFINSIYYNSVHTGSTDDFLNQNELVGNMTLTENYNWTYPYGAAAGAESSPPNGAHTGYVNPNFNNPTSTSQPDLTLKIGSKCAGAAGPMTTTTSSSGNGASYTLTVVDALPFSDGTMGSGGAAIADADYVIISSITNTPIAIASVNYGNNTITLATATTWQSGDGVWLMGTQDIGALPSETGYRPAGRLSCTITDTSGLVNVANPSQTISISVESSDDVRKVNFFLDGVPMNAAPIYMTPGGSTSASVTFNYDGGSHIIEERAYNRFASQTPFVSNFLTLPTPPVPTPTPTPTTTPTPTPTPSPTPTAPFSRTGLGPLHLNGANPHP